MKIHQMISAGAPGAESAALDVAIRLKIPYGGYVLEKTMGDQYWIAGRYSLWEKSFATSRDRDEANVQFADATLIFSHGDLNDALAYIEHYAVSHERPCHHVDFNKVKQLQAAFHISLWAEKHALESLFITGSSEADDPRIYQATYDTLIRFLMLGKEEYPGHKHLGSDEKELPTTLEDAVAYLVEVLPLKEKVTIANMSASEIARLNLSLGSYIRNTFELRTGNRQLLWACAKDAGKEILHEDEASAIIIARLALELEQSHKLRTV